MSSCALPSLDGFDAAIGFAVQQHLFALGITRAKLGELLGIPGQSVSSRLYGRVRWTAGDLAIAAETFGIEVADLYPSHGAAGWVPAQYVPGSGRRKAPARAGAGASEAVPPVGLEPTTFGLKVPIPEPRWAAGTETPVTPALPLNTGVDGPIAPAPAEAA